MSSLPGRMVMYEPKDPKTGLPVAGPPWIGYILRVRRRKAARRREYFIEWKNKVMSDYAGRKHTRCWMEARYVRVLADEEAAIVVLSGQA